MIHKPVRSSAQENCSQESIKSGDLAKLVEVLSGSDEVDANDESTSRASAEKSTNSVLLELSGAAFDTIMAADSIASSAANHYTPNERISQYKPDFRLLATEAVEEEANKVCSLCTDFIDSTDGEEDFYTVRGPKARQFSCMRCKFALCKICTRELASQKAAKIKPGTREGSSELVILNKCPKCDFLGARRPWYPPVLHALTTPINFVAS